MKQLLDVCCTMSDPPSNRAPNNSEYLVIPIQLRTAAPDECGADTRLVPAKLELHRKDKSAYSRSGLLKAYKRMLRGYPTDQQTSLSSSTALHLPQISCSHSRSSLSSPPSLAWSQPNPTRSRYVILTTPPRHRPPTLLLTLTTSFTPHDHQLQVR